LYSSRRRGRRRMISGFRRTRAANGSCASSIMPNRPAWTRRAAIRRAWRHCRKSWPESVPARRTGQYGTSPTESAPQPMPLRLPAPQRTVKTSWPSSRTAGPMCIRLDLIDRYLRKFPKKCPARQGIFAAMADAGLTVSSPCPFIRRPAVNRIF
jgi:hypothetical protein